jgi:predicted nucleic acid-binding protein
MILDTNFLIALDANQPEAMEKAKELERMGVPRRVPRIVIFELWESVGKGTQTESNRRESEQVITGLPQAELTESIAKRAGEIEGQAQAAHPKGHGIGVADSIIAATALEYDEPVVTDDRTDFVDRMQQTLGLTNLRVELYT